MTRSLNMRPFDPHGLLEPSEEAIMDLWDAALSEEEIARQLCLSETRVRAVIMNMAEGRADRWAIHARAATERLGIALKAMAA